MGYAEEEIARLHSEGVGPHDRLWVTHMFTHHPSIEHDRGLFLGALRRAGFGTGHRSTLDRTLGSIEEIDGDQYWHHWADTFVKASVSEVKHLDDIGRDLAASYGVRYDGWIIQEDINPLQHRVG